MAIGSHFKIDEVVSSQLASLVKTANLITQDEGIIKLTEQLRSQQLRIRPSVHSFSLVSYSETTPQLGFPDIRSASRLAAKLKQPIPKPCRVTPEKKLQSWLIRSTASTGGELVPLSNLFGSRFWFVSDELAISVVAISEAKRTRKRIIADLLLVREDDQGLAQFVNVELKSKRTTDTFTQVLNFRPLIEHSELKKVWRQFAQTMTGKVFNWEDASNTHGLVIWPKASDRSRFVMSGDRDQRIDLIGYAPDASGYTLKIESRAA